MLLRFAAGFLAGGTLSVLQGSTDSHAAEPPTLNAVMDPEQDIVPVRAVIVGGGYSGSRLAYQLDSIFDVTFIDEKNFFELTNDIIPIIANPWDDEKHPEACRRMMSLHRYYLKRCNVLTSTVDGVGERYVMLKDGRSVPYDLLFVTTGERKPFPFHTQQRTISGRVQELKLFNQFLTTECKKVAIIGGGPVGVSLAHDLATSRPEMEVHLYHRRGELLPVLPGLCRRYALEKIEASPNLHVHLSHHVTAVEGFDKKDGAGGKAVADTTPLVAAAAKRAVAADSAAAATGLSGVWQRWFTSSSSSSSMASVREAASFAVHYDRLQYERQPQQSIISQIYHGKRDEVAACGAVEASAVESGFDYVFPCAGDTAQPIIAGKGKPNILLEHETPDGHYRVSTLSQLFGMPHVFASGRCTNLPVPRGYGSSDIEARTLFRALNTVVNNPTTSFMQAHDGVQIGRMKIPRLHVRLGVDDAVGCTPWSGALTGVPAVHEFMQDRHFLAKDFVKPIFFKQQDQVKIKRRIDDWKAHEITDIVDFSHS